jgi:putative transcriptional regulator
MTESRDSEIKALSGKEVGLKLLRAVREMKAGKAARTTIVEANVVAAARARTGLSQAEFATALRISVRTVQEWEQGRRTPSGAALSLIEMVFAHPEWVREVNDAGA